MSEKIIKYIKINGLQYNALRDPQVYRRLAGEPVRVQVVVGGSRLADLKITDEKNVVLAETQLQAPGIFSHELRFDQAGVRIVTISARAGEQAEHINMRLDIMAHAWVG